MELKNYSTMYPACTAVWCAGTRVSRQSAELAVEAGRTRTLALARGRRPGPSRRPRQRTTSHLSPGVSLISDLAHDSGILQSEHPRPQTGLTQKSLLTHVVSYKSCMKPSTLEHRNICKLFPFGTFKTLFFFCKLQQK